MKSSVTGIENFMAKLAAIPAGVNKPVRVAIAAAALKVEGDAKLNVLRGSKTGRIYKRGKKRIHQASAPGESPASDSGAMVAAITQQITAGGLDAEVGVFGSVPGKDGKPRNYPKDLEFGTSKMAARPWLLPALEKNRKQILSSVERAVNAALTKVDK